MRRRDFIAGFGGAAVWPVAAQAQLRTLPKIGWLDSASPEAARDSLPAFRQGLTETGFVEGRNVAIEYRWAQGHEDRLPSLAADLVGRKVAAIITPASTPAALAAKAATNSIPILFSLGGDPVESGLVASFNRPSGNVTGVHNFSGEVITKRVDLLHQMVPDAKSIGILAYSANPYFTQFETRNLQTAAGILGLRVLILTAETASEIEAAFATVVENQIGGLLIAAAPFFGVERRTQIILLAARHAIPTMFWESEAVEAGALMSYGNENAWEYRQLGLYAGRILRGEKPADLPVVQPTRFEFAINLQTASILGIKVPPTLLAIADRVIE
jgi:putative tryptophan/tyrosine transport system substrate-binding protein